METNAAQLAIHEQLLAWFEAHRREVLWAATLVMVAGIGTGFFFWHHNENESDANNALSKAGAPLNGQAVTAAEVLKVASAYPNTDAAARALLIGGGMLFVDGNYADARSQFEKYLREHRDSPLATQALLGIAACLEAQANTNEAIAAYRDIIEHHPSDYAVPQAKFALARLFEGQGKLEPARDLYLTIARPGVYETISAQSATRLKEMILKHPELAPSRAPTVPPTMPALKFSNP